MPLTNFPNGITSFGIPVVGGMQVPFGKNSKVYFVDPKNGADGNDGSKDRPLKTLTQALSLCVAGRNDVVFLMTDGTTAATARLSAALDWNKDSTHLIGIAPNSLNSRARVSNTSGVNFTPLFTLSASNCLIANVSFFQGYATNTAQKCFVLSGQRNQIVSCRISGMGAAEAGDAAGSASLSVEGGDENRIDDCIIGLDTVPRSTTNAEIVFSGAATRNEFNNCLVETYADNAGHLFVSIGSLGIDRYAIFNNCTFLNPVGAASTSLTAVVSVHASAGGNLLLRGCTYVGATHWVGADNTMVYIDGPVPNGQTTGKAVTADLP